MDIETGDLTAPDVVALLAAHLEEAAAVTPAESVHSLNLTELADPAVTFWTARRDGILLGCAALKALDPARGEVKSMRTDPRHLSRGVGARLLEHLLEQARVRGHREVLLETGVEGFYAPARRLYRRHGFRPCPPFGSYTNDPNSVFLSRTV